MQDKIFGGVPSPCKFMDKLKNFLFPPLQTGRITVK